jgi:hypothetical protein
MTTLTRLNALFQALLTRPLNEVARPIQSHHNVIPDPKATLSLFSSYGAWLLWLLKFYYAARSHWDVMVGVGKSHSNVNFGDGSASRPSLQSSLPPASPFAALVPGRISGAANSCFFSRNCAEALAL